MIRHPVARAAGWLALIAWAPLPFGSVTPRWTFLLVAAALVVAGITPTLDLATPIPRTPRRIATLLAAVAVLGLLQSIAWPTALADLLSPGHAQLVRSSAEVLGHAEPAVVPLSLAPSSSRRTALVWLTAAAALAGGSLAFGSRRARRGLLIALAGSALLQILYGARLWAIHATSIWGTEVPNQPTRLRGSFVNPNHLATYLLIAAAAAFAYLWWNLRRMRDYEPAERWLVRLGPALLLWLFVLVGLAFTRSRAGLLAALGGLAVQLALIAGAGGRRRVLWGSVVALLAGIAYVAQAGMETAFGRFMRITAEGEFRLAAMADAWRLFEQFPLTGVGLGAFRAAFPLVHAVGEEGSWWHVHNDWLELAVTAGAVGVALVGIAVFLLARGLLRTWRCESRGEDRAAALTALGACVAVGLQELLDFGLTIPANSLTLAIVCGAALGAGRRRASRVRSSPGKESAQGG